MYNTYDITNNKKQNKLSIKDLIDKYIYIVGFWKDNIIDIDNNF